MLTKTFEQVGTTDETRSITFTSHCGSEGNQNTYQFYITAWSDEVDTKTGKPTSVLIPTEHFQCVGNDNHLPRCPPAQCAGEDCACCNSEGWVPEWYRSQVNTCKCLNDNDEDLARLNMGESTCIAAAAKGACNHPQLGYKVQELCPCHCADADENRPETPQPAPNDDGSKTGVDADDDFDFYFGAADDEGSGGSSGAVVGVSVALLLLAAGGAGFVLKKRRGAAALAAAEKTVVPLESTTVVKPEHASARHSSTKASSTSTPVPVATYFMASASA